MDQLNLFENSDQYSIDTVKNGLNITSNGEFVYYPDFFPKIESDAFFKVFKDEVAWKQEAMIIYGKRINFSRLTAWYGDNDKPYSFQELRWHLYPGIAIC
jgi:hypothetical protein